jgi:hypothetical protein
MSTLQELNARLDEIQLGYLGAGGALQDSRATRNLIDLFRSGGWKVNPKSTILKGINTAPMTSTGGLIERLSKKVVGATIKPMHQYAQIRMLRTYPEAAQHLGGVIAKKTHAQERKVAAGLMKIARFTPEAKRATLRGMNDRFRGLAARIDEIIEFSGEYYKRFVPDDIYNTTEEGRRIRDAITIKQPGKKTSIVRSKIFTDSLGKEYRADSFAVRKALPGPHSISGNTAIPLKGLTEQSRRTIEEHANERNISKRDAYKELTRAGTKLPGLTPEVTGTRYYSHNQHGKPDAKWARPKFYDYEKSRSVRRAEYLKANAENLIDAPAMHEAEERIRVSAARLGKSENMAEAMVKAAHDKKRASEQALLEGGRKADAQISSHRSQMASRLAESRRIIHGFRKANNLTISEAYRQIKPDDIPTYRARLHAAEEVSKAQAGLTLDKMQRAYKARISRGVERETKGVLPKFETDRMAGAAYGGLTNTGNIQTAAKYLKKGSNIPGSSKPTAVAETVRSALLRAHNAANLNPAGRASEQARILSSRPDFFKTAKQLGTKAAEESGYPNLKKLGIGAGVLGALGVGAYVGKKYYDRKKAQAQPVAMSSRLGIITFGKGGGRAARQAQREIEEAVTKLVKPKPRPLAPSGPVGKDAAGNPVFARDILKTEEASRLLKTQQQVPSEVLPIDPTRRRNNAPFQHEPSVGFVYPGDINPKLEYRHAQSPVARLKGAARRLAERKLSKAMRSGELVHEGELKSAKDTISHLKGLMKKSSDDAATEAMRIKNTTTYGPYEANPAAGSKVGDYASAREEGMKEAAEKMGRSMDALKSAHQARLKEASDKAARDAIEAAKGRAWLAIGAGTIGATAGAGTVALLKRKREEHRFEEKRRIHPAVTAGLSGALSGAIIGSIPAFKTGATLKGSLRSIGTGAATAAGIVGGGTVVGTHILGEPKEKEAAAYTKRAALGGAIIGTTAGLGAGLLAHNTKWGSKKLYTYARDWWPARLAMKGGTVGAMGIGGVAGGIIGAGHAADEGQQVDTIQALTKAARKKKEFSSKMKPIQFDTYEDEIIKKRVKHISVAPDRYKKTIINAEHDRRDANYGRTALVGAVLGSQFRKGLNMPVGRAALVGAGAGLATQALIRNAVTRDVRDKFGEKTVTAKRVEMSPWVAGAGVAGAVGLRRLYKKSPLAQRIVQKYFSAKGRIIRFDQGMVVTSGEARHLREGRAQRYGEDQWKRIKRYGRVYESGKHAVTGTPNLDSRGREKTPEWKKPWAITAMVGGGLGLAFLGGKAMLHGAPAGSGRARVADLLKAKKFRAAARESIPGYRQVADFANNVAKETGRAFDRPLGKVADTVEKAASGASTVEKEAAILKAAQDAQRRAAMEKEDILNKLKKRGSGEERYSAKGRIIQLADYSPYWRTADERGNSARVYAPGHQVRERRKMEWYERKSTHQGALLASLLGTVVTGVVMQNKGYFRGDAARKMILKKEAEAASRAAAKKTTQAAAMPMDPIVEADLRAAAELRRQRDNLAGVASGPKKKDPKPYRDKRRRGGDDEGPAGSLILNSSRLKPIYFDSRRDPEERLRDKLAIASSTAKTAGLLGVLGSGSYVAIKGRKYVRPLIEHAKSAIVQGKGVGVAADNISKSVGQIDDNLRGAASAMGASASSIKRHAQSTKGGGIAMRLYRMAIGGREIKASSKTTAIYFDRRDPEEKLRDRLAMAKSVGGITVGTGALAGGIYVARRASQSGPRYAQSAHDWLSGAEELSKGLKSTSERLTKGAADSADLHKATRVNSKIIAREIKRRNGSWLKRLLLSSATKPILFQLRDDDHSKKAALIGGGAGFVAGTQYIGGRKYKSGEDLTGRRVVRRSIIIPGGHHEGIGSGNGMVVHVTDVGSKGKRNIRVVEEPVDKFLAGKSGRVLDKDTSSHIAERARARAGSEFKKWNLFTNNCSTLSDCIRGTRKRLVSRQWERGIIGGAAGVAVAYGGAKLAASLRKKDDSLKNLSARIDTILFSKKNDRDDRINSTLKGAGVALVAVTALPIYRAANPTVGITYGKTNAYRGHMSHAEDVQKILSDHGIKSSQHNNAGNIASAISQQRHSVEVNTGYGLPVAGAVKVKYRPDYLTIEDKALPVVPAEMAAARPTGRRTIGVYGGGGGVNIAEKLPHLAGVAKDVDAIHIYAGPSQKVSGPGYAGGGHEEASKAVETLRKTHPEVASKIRVHGLMNRKAIKNAVRSHTVNVGNSGANTMHEIATAGRPGVIWQAGEYPNSPHFKVNEDWARRRGVNVATGKTAAERSDSAIRQIRDILGNERQAIAAHQKAATALIEEGKVSRAAFVSEVKDALRKSRKRNIIAAAGLGLAGTGLIATSRDRQMSSLGAVIQFAEDREESGKSKLRRAALIAAGTGVAGLGIAAIPGAIPMAKIAARENIFKLRTSLSKGKHTSKIFSAPKIAENASGSMVADYIESANTLMNRGITGAITKRVLEHTRKNPTGFVARNLGIKHDMAQSHYDAFRGSPKRALEHWDWEYGGLLEHRVEQALLPVAKREVGWEKETLTRAAADRTHRIMARGRKIVTGDTPYGGAINEVMQKTGKNEMDALRHVAEGKYTPKATESQISAARKSHAEKSQYPSPAMSREEAAAQVEASSRKDMHAYFRSLSHQNAKAAMKYAKLYTVAPGMVAAGGGVAAAGVYGTRRDERGRKLKTKDYLPSRLKELSARIDALLA